MCCVSNCCVVCLQAMCCVSNCVVCLQAMWLMLQQETPEDFVISTGVAHSVREFVVAAFKHIGIEIV